MSVLNFLKLRDDEYMTGYYYDFKPDPTHTIEEQLEEGRKVFRYSKAENQRKNYDTFMNMRSDSATYAIKTSDDCGFKIGGYVSTQNGLFWIIQEIILDEQVDGNEEAFMMWKKPIKTEFLLRLSRVDNPWEIGV